MARFLLTVWPFETHLNPNLALAHALKEHSHEVAFYTGPTAVPAVRGEGFRCFLFREVDWANIERVVNSIVSRTERSWRLDKLWLEFLPATVPAQLRDLEAVLDEWRPDALVCDVAMWGPILILHESRCLPVAVFSHISSCLVPGPDGPIPGISMPRPRTGLAQFRARLSLKAAGIMTRGIRRETNRLRRAHGLAPLATSFAEFCGTMPLYIVPSTPEFDYQRKDLPASVHYVGPCLWDKPASLPPPEWIHEVPADGLRILVTEGTLYTKDPAVLRMASQGLAGLPVSVLLIAGKGRPVSELGLTSLPQNMTVREWTPLSDLLPLVDAVLTNGNSETVLAALTRGLPLVAVPSIWEQSETAWRVSDCGAGICLPASRCTPSRLRDAVKRVLEEPSFRRNAERLAGAFTRYGGARQAARLLEVLASEASKN